jgi:hypothetical protein
VPAASDAELEPSAAYSVSRTPLTTVATCDDAATRQCSSGSGSPREIDARDLEQRDVVGAGVDTRAHGFDETRHDGGPEDGLLRGHGTREPDCLGIRIGRDEAPRVRLGETSPDERVLDDAAQPLLLREAAQDM